LLSQRIGGYQSPVESDIFSPHMNLNRTQVLGALLLGVIILAILLTRWKLAH
jgi:hypothetical protein